MHKLAENLIAYETDADAAGAVESPAQLVCDKLRPHLATLMGITGFLALLTRALTRATVRMPALRAMQVSQSGSLERLIPAVSRDNPGQDTESSIVLIAELLSLLSAFIGMNLTVQLVRNIWPEMTVDEPNSRPGESE